MGIPTIANDTPLSFIKEEDNHTRSHLEANPLTAALAVPFVGFITQTWPQVQAKEEALAYDLALAEAKVLHANSALSGLVHKLDSALLMLTGKDRKALLYARYFGDRRPFEVAACGLGQKLEMMRGWLPDLLVSPHAMLKAIGAELEGAVATADAAAAAKLAVENAIATFGTTGERGQAVEAYNALRKETYGALGKLRHQSPELPRAFAEGFFQHGENRSLDRLSPDELQVKIDGLAAQQALLQKKLQAAVERLKAEADAKLALDQKQKRAALNAKRKKLAALQADLARMEAELVK